MVPSDQPHIWENDTTLTAYLPPSGCRIVQRNRCPPNHPVVGWLAVSRIRESTLWQRCPATNCLNPWRCIIPRWWTNEPTKATFALTHDPLQQQSSSSGESLQSQTAYVHAIMTPYDSCRRVLWQLLIKHTDEADMYHNSATQSWDCVMRRRQGWMVGRKTTDEVGCLNTLMNSLNEVISVHSCAKKQRVNWQKSLNA